MHLVEAETHFLLQGREGETTGLMCSFNNRPSPFHWLRKLVSTCRLEPGVSQDLYRGQVWAGITPESCSAARHLLLFVRAAIRKYHRPGHLTTETSFFPSQVRRLDVQVHGVSRVSFILRPLSLAGRWPPTSDGHLLAVILLYSQAPLASLSLQDTSQTGPKPTLWVSYYFNHLLIGSISKYSLYSQGLKARAPKYEFWGTQFSTKHLYTSESERLLTCCSQAGPWPLIAPVQLIQPERKKGASLYWASTWTLGKTIWGTMISRFLGYHGCTKSRKETEPTAQGLHSVKGSAVRGHCKPTCTASL